MAQTRLDQLAEDICNDLKYLKPDTEMGLQDVKNLVNAYMNEMESTIIQNLRTKSFVEEIGPQHIQQFHHEVLL